MTAPVSLIVSAFAPVADVRLTLTPQLRCGASTSTSTSSLNDQSQDPILLLIDLGRGKSRLGGSILAQVVSQMGETTPDVDNPTDLKNFWNAIQQLGRERKLLAYHDRSDGGLLATITEMAFAGNTGVNLELPHGHEIFSSLFNEELGAVIQIRDSDLDHVSAVLRQHGLKACVSRIGTLNTTQTLTIARSGKVLFSEKLSALRALWSDVTRRIASLRDNPACAEQEHALRLDPTNPGLSPKLTFPLPSSASPPSANPQSTIRHPQSSAPRPAVAILREQGVNGQLEMAAAFTRAGFRAVDVHMTDILSGRTSLRDFAGLAACGGFSYGDVLGAGEGWAKSILFHDRARAEFAAFFAREDAFALGVCNGCQMMSNLKSLIPGAELWPRFVQNKSERYEARFVSLKIEHSPSIFFRDMTGSVIPVVVAHGEGFTEFPDAAAAQTCSDSGLVTARYVDNHHRVTEHYPLNPNGSPFGMTALTTTTGRVTILMPHPERVHRTVSLSWHPDEWSSSEESPWMKLFHNARAWVG